MESLAILVKPESRWHTVVAQVASLLDAVCFEAEAESWCWSQMQAGLVIKVNALYCIVVLTCFDLFFLCLFCIQEVVDHLNHRVFLYIFVPTECWMFCERSPFQPVRR